MESKNISESESSNATFPNIESRLQADELINHISFNSDKNAFAIATSKGFAIYTLEPFSCRVKRQLEGGVKLVQMVGQSNLVILVTTGLDPNYQSNFVHFWDDQKTKIVGRVQLS